MISSIIEEKVAQAVSILHALDVDAWLTFVRETGEGGDTILPLILGQTLTWQSALVVTRSGERIAIVGKFDDEAVRAGGVWAEVIPYVQSIRQPLLDILRRIDPRTVAINFSKDDVKADGLSHGMYLLLQNYLSGTPFVDRIVSADKIIGALRGRKTRGEIDRLRAAVAATDGIFEIVAKHARPGMTEEEVAHFIKNEAERRSLGLAWDPKMCPIVNTGPDSMIGHGVPSALKIEPGHVLHIDFGVVKDEYCSDLQRCWYVPVAGETAPPDSVRRALETVVKAIQAAAAALKPGTVCWQVDAAARKTVVEAGYPEYEHATGHQVGRSAHDGAAVLAPRWERYGQTPYRKAEIGNVFTLELGIKDTSGRGYVGLEEMVVVTADGCEYLSTPQTSLPLLG